ncbi:aldolase [Paenibacillus lignilyticus]|uniref:Aldolase n=1 Tax=Paenibacillus lignilyticus TaxID=1172615 RepID=A0ABS5C760_9BACL|nr:aldolase [Paenibacillus lignilyticus]MBP3961795.1 aldolase [Paenibacillus lignilyticus]MBP3963534.1 aldolase [Paenibacillus lignilyticus]
MNPAVKRTIYRAFGLTMASEIALPELLREAEQTCEADVYIDKDDLYQAWNESSGSGSDDYCALEGDDFMLNIEGTAIYRVRGGNRITVSPTIGADDAVVRLYLLGTCMGVLLFQRKMLPLHGSAVVINGKAYAFVGDSGAGKSTLAAAFLKRGYPLLTDDVIAVTLNRDRVPVVIPSYPQQKLWQESIDKLGMQSDRYVPLYETKYAIPAASMFCEEPVPLAGIFELVKTDGCGTELRHLQGLERLPTIRFHTYRHFLIPQLGLDQWHFSASVSIVNHINMYQLCRPAERFTAYDLVSRILNTVEEGIRISHG